YEGHSSFLNTLVAGFTAPSLRDVDIKLRYTDDINPPILHLSRPPPAEFQTGYDTYPQYDGADEQPVFLQCSSPAEELTIHVDNREVEDIVFLWRQFLMQFPSVKVLRMYGDHKASSNHGIACALHYDHGGHNLALLPALEEIELCLGQV
ncbi:hypothetical protein BJV77DRAFT_966926, partial [Russula vinacea]